MAEEGFHDYTLATHLERLVAQLEQCFRGWMLTGLEHISHMPPAVGADKYPANIVKISNNLKHRLPWREQPYILTLHVPYTREAELQAARQQQYQQQQRQQQQKLIQTRQASLQSTAPKPAAVVLALGVAPSADVETSQQDAAAATQLELTHEQQTADEFQFAAPAAAAAVSAPVADATAGVGAQQSGNSSSNNQLDQRVQDLIEEYRQLHLQLQEDDDTAEQQQQQQLVGEQDTSTVDASQVHLELETPAAAAAPQRAVSPVVKAEAPAAAAAAASEPAKLKAPAAKEAAAAAVEEAPSESEETEDQNSIRQVDLPAPEDLLLPNSTALAAAQAAVRQDQSRTAVSRTWWPHCFAGSSSSTDPNLGQQTQTLAGSDQSQSDLDQANSSKPWTDADRQIRSQLYQAVQSLKAPWWAPVSSIHKLQRWFGLDLFVLLQPASYSRRLLDSAEASSLLSVGRLALSSSGVTWPLLLPVHDALRDAYCGVAQVAGSSVYFTSDSIHISRLPRHLTIPQQQILVFADQLAPYNAAAAAACVAAAGQTAAGSSDGSSSGYSVWMSACCTFKLPDVSKMHWIQQQQQGSRGSSSRSSLSGDLALRNSSGSSLHNPYPAGLRNPPFDDEDLMGVDWDADSAWHPWAQQRDPIRSIELDLIWEDLQITDQVQGSRSGADQHADRQQESLEPDLRSYPPGCQISAGSVLDLLSDVSAADHWILHVVSHGYSSTPIKQGRLGMRSSNRHRRHVTLAASGADWLWTAELAQQVLAEGGRLSGVCPQPFGYNTGSSTGSSGKRQAAAPLDPGSFTTMLSALMTARTAAAAANSLWELAGAEWWESRGEPTVPPRPPDSVFDSVIRDLFSPGRATAAGAAAAGSNRTGSRRSSWVDPWDARSVSSSSAQQQEPLEGDPAAAAAGGSSSSDDDLPRSAPSGSLLCRLALHALVFGNARAIAALWQRIVNHIRLQFWEQRALLPYMPAAAAAAGGQHSNTGHSPMADASNTWERSQITSQIVAGGMSNVSGGPPAPDLDSCLLHQKLQMLNVCIWRRDKRLSRGLSLQQQQLPLEQVVDQGNDDSSSSGSGNSSGAKGVITAASSSFFSAAEDDDDLAQAEAEENEVSSQQQQQQQSDDTYQDARSELSISSSNGGSSISGQQQNRSPTPPDQHQWQQDGFADPWQQQQQQQPEGVAGVLAGEFLLNFPDRPLRIPIVQEDPVFTEDQIMQRQAALLQLAEATTAASSSTETNAVLADPAAASAAAADVDLLLAKQRLLAAPLLSDMSAFKAANPGCCFEDFVRWYSPKDWQQQQQGDEQQQQQQPEHSDQQDQADHAQSKVSDLLPATAPAARSCQISARMSGSGPGSWQQLWSLAAAVPAAGQRPLLNAIKEGELVLHYLETISPAALFSQLLAAAVNEALQLLSASSGASLPAAAAVVDRFQSMAASVLRKGGGLAEALAAAAPQQQQHLAGDYHGAESGLSDIELELLLAEFHYVEQVVVLGESLLHRLPDQRHLAARLLANLVQGIGSSSDLSSSSSDLTVGENADQRVLGAAGFLPVAALSNAEKVALMKWVTAAAAQHPRSFWQQRQQQQQQVSASSSDADLGPTNEGLLAAAAAAAVPSGSSSSKWQQQVQSLQGYLGEPAQREWVVTCARPSAAAAAAAVGSSDPNSSSSSKTVKLKASVAAAVAAATNASQAAAAAVPVPPSRMYLQEADDEMRMAFTLVSDPVL